MILIKDSTLNKYFIRLLLGIILPIITIWGQASQDDDTPGLSYIELNPEINDHFISLMKDLEEILLSSQIPWKTKILNMSATFHLAMDRWLEDAIQAKRDQLIEADPTHEKWAALCLEFIIIEQALFVAESYGVLSTSKVEEIYPLNKKLISQYLYQNLEFGFQNPDTKARLQQLIKQFRDQLVDLTNFPQIRIANINNELLVNVIQDHVHRYPPIFQSAERSDLNQMVLSAILKKKFQNNPYTPFSAVAYALQIANGDEKTWIHRNSTEFAKTVKGWVEGEQIESIQDFEAFSYWDFIGYFIKGFLTINPALCKEIANSSNAAVNHDDIARLGNKLDQYMTLKSNYIPLIPEFLLIKAQMNLLHSTLSTEHSSFAL